MIWPFTKKKTNEKVDTHAKESVTTISNSKLKAALNAHEQLQTPQSHLQLLQELNLARYLIASIDDEVKFINNSETNEPIIGQDSTFKFLLCSHPDGKPLLTLFTDYQELESWAKDKSNSSWVVSAQEAWGFSQKLSIGVIVNPSGAGWIMGQESITWLQKHPL